MVKMLITIGNADVNALDNENRSPLHSCGNYYETFSFCSQISKINFWFFSMAR